MLHGINKQGNSLDVKNYNIIISEEMNIFHTFTYKSLATGTLIIKIIVIADNKPINLCYRFYILTSYHIFTNAYNVNIFR